MEQTRYLTTKQAAELLGYAESYIRLLARNGQIPAYKVRGTWRFSLQEIKRWVESGGITSPPK